MSSEIDTIVNGDIDLYEFLEVDPSLEVNEIKRQYRRKALQYHPDKNPSEDAARKFHLLSQVYEILTNENLRSNYDRIRQLRINKEERTKKISEQTKAFKEELEKAEREHRFNNSDVFDNSSKEFVQRKIWENNLEKLKEEGLKKRRMNEREIIKQSAHSPSQLKKYISFEDMPLQFEKVPILRDYTKSNDNHMNSLKQTKTRVRWKHKSELHDLFSADILQDIMMIFGPVKFVDIFPNNNKSRYDTGIVEFEQPESAQLAVNHDYRKSASLWDGTRVRKLASLLRECDYYNPIGIITTKNQAASHYDDSKIERLISKQNQTTKFDPPSKYDISKVRLRSDTYMDQVISHFIMNEADSKEM